jgi:tetratricopeptide (TPR) repeat protein
MMMKNFGTTLNNVSMFVLVQLVVLGTTNAFAQDEKFGDQPEKCKENLSLYREYYKQKNYQDALPGWRWVFFNCPESTKNIVINGPTIIEDQIKKHAADPAMKKAYMDTLYMVYDKRIAIYPEDKGYALGQKGMYMYDYSEGDYTAAFDVLLQSMETSKLETDAYVIMKLYLAGMKRLVAKQVEMEVMYDLYDKVSVIFAHQYKKFEPGTTIENSDFKKLKQVNDLVDQNFERIAQEDQYILMMQPKVDANPKDTALLEKVSTMMVKRNWTNHPFYLSTSEKLYKLSPNATAAYNLYEANAKKGNDSEAAKYLEESVKLTQDKAEKADRMLKLAKVYGGAKNYSKARSTALEAAGLKSGWGEPFIYIGDLYLGTSSSCGNDDCSRKYGIWAAEDMYVKARSIDASIAETANSKISSCRKYYPMKKDCFFINLESGASVTVGGWISTETTARFAD